MNGWVDAGPLDAIDEEDLIRLDHDGATYIIARDDQGGVYAADGLCVWLHSGMPASSGTIRLEDRCAQGWPGDDCTCDLSGRRPRRPRFRQAGWLI